MGVLVMTGVGSAAKASAVTSTSADVTGTVASHSMLTSSFDKGTGLADAAARRLGARVSS
jgi:hypothetical protein